MDRARKLGHAVRFGGLSTGSPNFRHAEPGLSTFRRFAVKRPASLDRKARLLRFGPSEMIFRNPLRDFASI